MKFVAEFCQNHNGDFYILKDMIAQAAEAGANYGKIQTIFADDLSYRERFENEEDSTSIFRPYKSEYERLKKLELSYELQEAFVSECKKYNLIPTTTCFNRGSIQAIKNLKLDTIKVASYDCSSLPLIEELSKYFQKLIISTGATHDEEIIATANYLKKKKIDFVFLHCVTIYPTPLNEIHLNRMEYLEQFTNNVGFSEHTNSIKDGTKASLAACYFGAKFIERHFTILDPKETKDGIVSINPKQLKEIVDFSKLSKTDQKLYLTKNVSEYDTMLGSKYRSLSIEELKNRDYYRGRFADHINGNTVYNWEDLD